MHFTSSGTLIDTLDDGAGAGQTTDGCFDAAGAFYGTNYGLGSILKWGVNGNLVAANFIDRSTGANGDGSPNSCLFDAAGNIFVAVGGQFINNTTYSESSARLGPNSRPSL